MAEMIKSNTCPYCGGPYTLTDGGCRARCPKSQRVAQLIAEAAEYQEMYPSEEQEIHARERNTQHRRSV